MFIVDIWLLVLVKVIEPVSATPPVGLKLTKSLVRPEIWLMETSVSKLTSLLLGKEGNKKDIEDAKHLYELFKEKLNNKELLILIKELNAEKEFKLINFLFRDS